MDQPGEKMFVDYAGATIPIHDRVTGEIHQFAFNVPQSIGHGVMELG